MVFLKNALMCMLKNVKLINQDCLPILMLLYIMLYIMLAYSMLLYLMLFVCIMLLFLHLFLQMLFVFMFCLGLLSHSLFISCVNLHYAQCFNLLVFPNSVFTSLLFENNNERAMCSPEK